MKKQNLLFAALTLSIITVGSISVPNIIKAERLKTSSVDLKAESISENERNNNKLNAAENDSTDNYGDVICYSGQDLETHQLNYQDEILNMHKHEPEDEYEIPFIYEYRGYRVGFYYQKNIEKDSDYYMAVDASDVAPEVIVKKAIDTFLDVDNIDLEDKAIIMTLNNDRLGFDGYTVKRYSIEIYDIDTILGHVPHGLHYYGYLSLSGEPDAFYHPNYEDSKVSENTSELKYWPNTGEAAEGVYGETFGMAESETDYALLEKYTQIVNDKLKDYGITKMKEIKLGYIEGSTLRLFAYMEDGYFDEIDYSLKYDEIVRYKKRTEPEYTKFLLYANLPEEVRLHLMPPITE